MDYKQKYEEALERAKILMTKGYDVLMPEIFPELKEGEDEKIRKELITWLQNTEGQVLPIDRYNAAFDWLEKQSGQKPAEWSEEDEQQMKSCLDFLDNISCGDDSELNDCRNWLKSLNQRMKGK